MADEVCVTVRRFHDLGRTGSDYWLLLIPFYNIYLGLVLLMKKGDESPNLYDEGSQEVQEVVSREFACGRCGSEIKAGDSHCPHCGEVLEF